MNEGNEGHRVVGLCAQCTTPVYRGGPYWRFEQRLRLVYGRRTGKASTPWAPTGAFLCARCGDIRDSGIHPGQQALDL